LREAEVRAAAKPGAKSLPAHCDKLIGKEAAVSNETQRNVKSRLLAVNSPFRTHAGGCPVAGEFENGAPLRGESL
jgi:hypothetical protein